MPIERIIAIAFVVLVIVVVIFAAVFHRSSMVEDVIVMRGI